MLLEHAEVSRKLEVLGQIADLLTNAQLVTAPAGQRHQPPQSTRRSSYKTSSRPSLTAALDGEVTSDIAARASMHTFAVQGDSERGETREGSDITSVLSRFVKKVQQEQQQQQQLSAGEAGRKTGSRLGCNRSEGDLATGHTADGATASAMGAREEAALCYAAGLQLPRSCGSDVVAALNELGLALRQACSELTTAIDSQLVAFFDHMKRKEVAGLGGIATVRRIVPVGFEVREGPFVAPPAAAITSVSAPAERDFVWAAATPANNAHGEDGGFEEDLREWRNACGGHVQSGTLARARSPGRDTILPRPSWVDGTNAYDVASTTGAVATGHTASTREASGRAGGSSKRRKEDYSFTAAALRSTTSAGQLGQQLADSRSAASTLQAFLYLVLEAALTQCEATSGAVYLNETTTADTGASGEAANGAAAPARFLQSVAHINTSGHLPSTVSYATTHTLSTVVQTGIALNLRNSAYTIMGTGVPRDEQRDAVGAGAAPLPPNSRHLNVNNCVAVPIKNFGVVVVANKRSSAAEGGDFNLMDEHVVWGIALLCESLLTRYRRELLLQFAWNPSGVVLLRKFALLSPVHVGHRRRAGGPGQGCLDGPARHSEESHISKGLVDFISSRQTERPATHALPIVRTADERTLKAVPPELIPRRNNHGNAAPMPPEQPSGQAGASTGTVGEEDLYEGAARYIANLESLWRQALDANTSMQTLMERGDAEAAVQQERIGVLEAKVRRLNARIIQLERGEGLLLASSTRK